MASANSVRSESGTSLEEFLAADSLLRGQQMARYESPPMMRPQGAAGTSLPPTIAQTLDFLDDCVVAKLLHPILRAATREEDFKILREQWGEYSETLHAADVVLATALT